MSPMSAHVTQILSFIPFTTCVLSTRSHSALLWTAQHRKAESTLSEYVTKLGVEEAQLDQWAVSPIVGPSDRCFEWLDHARSGNCVD